MNEILEMEGQCPPGVHIESVQDAEPIWLLDCGLLGKDEPHEYPIDWTFGGADGNHPAADPRWEASVYRYLDEFAQPVWATVVPTCDHIALDGFTWVSGLGDTSPRYLEVRRPGATEFEILPWEYRAKSDTLHPMVVASA